MISQGSGEDTDDEYASDFEEYDSDDVSIRLKGNAFALHPPSHPFFRLVENALDGL